MADLRSISMADEQIQDGADNGETRNSHHNGGGDFSAPLTLNRVAGRNRCRCTRRCNFGDENRPAAFLFRLRHLLRLCCALCAVSAGSCCPLCESTHAPVSAHRSGSAAPGRSPVMSSLPFLRTGCSRNTAGRLRHGRLSDIVPVFLCRSRSGQLVETLRRSWNGQGKHQKQSYRKNDRTAFRRTIHSI